jgi:hypothetical protein
MTHVQGTGMCVDGLAWSSCHKQLLRNQVCVASGGDQVRGNWPAADVHMLMCTTCLCALHGQHAAAMRSC